MEPTKKIKILTSGLITVLGGIYGPILTPYFEKESTIFKLVAAGVKVVEVLDNGKEVTLSVSNFKTNNTATEKKPNKKAGHPVEPAVEEPKVEESVTEEVVEDKVEETPVETPAVEEPKVEESVTEEVVDDTVEETPVETPAVEEKAEEVSNTNYNYNKYNKNNRRK